VPSRSGAAVTGVDASQEGLPGATLDAGPGNLLLTTLCAGSGDLPEPSSDASRGDLPERSLDADPGDLPRASREMKGATVTAFRGQCCRHARPHLLERQLPQTKEQLSEPRLPPAATQRG
jgi:hypothetical protein